MFITDKNFVINKETNKIEMVKPILFSCGCGSVTASLASVSQFLATKVTQVRPAHHQIAKDWLKQEDLYEQIPLLKKHTYGVLIDNKLTNGKHKWVDLNAGAPIVIAERFKDILESE